MQTSINRERGFITARLSGPQTFETLRAAFAELTQSPDFDYSLNRLWDVRDADLEGLQAGDIASLTTFVQTRPHDAENARVAILVARELSPTVGGMFKLMFEGFMPENIKSFHDEVVAEEWISKTPA